MQLNHFINIISAIIGFAGAILLARGVLRSTPELMAKLSRSHISFSLVDIHNLSSQKADVVCGCYLLLLAFLPQIFALVFVQKPFDIFEDYWPSAYLAVTLSFSIIGVFLRINRWLSSHYKKQVKHVLAKWTLEEAFKKRRVDPADLGEVEEAVEILLGIKRQPNETWRVFLHRLAKLLGAYFPANLEIYGEPKREKQ